MRLSERVKGRGTGGRGEDAVTPVVGSILILVIMIMAIGGIMVWGAPAVAALQEQAQYEAVVSQFMQANADVRALWDPQNTKIVVMSFKTGYLEFRHGDRWVVSAAKDAAYDGLKLTGWEGSDPDSVTMEGVAFPLSGLKKITVSTAVGGLLTEVYSCTGGGCSSTISLGPPAPAACTTDRACLDTDVVRIQLTDNNAVKAESWIFNAGRLSYRYSREDTRSQIHFEMGAVFTQSQEAYFLQQTPSVKDPDASVGDTSLYVRILQLSGDEQTRQGSGRFPLTFSLVDNYGPNRGRPLYDPATMVRLQIDGQLEKAFCLYFDEKPGWVQEGAPADCSGTDATRTVDLRYIPGCAIPPCPMRYHLNHALVNTIA